MKTTIKNILILGLITLLSFTTSCEKPEYSPNLQTQHKSDVSYPSANKMGGASASDLINNAIVSWNKNFGYSVTAIGFTHIGNITNQANRDNIVSAITNPLAWAPYGDVMNPKSVSVKQLRDFKYNINKFESLIDSQILIGHELYRIEWKKDKTTFYTLCVFDDNDFIYDNIISNTLVPTTKTKKLDKNNNNPGYECRDPYSKRSIMVDWLFGLGERGRATINVTLDCSCDDGSCIVFNTIEDNESYLIFGTSEAKVKWLDSPNKNKCVKYAGLLILKLPMAEVTANFDVKVGKFEVKTSGIGTSYTQTFTKTLCCDTTGCSV